MLSTTGTIQSGEQEDVSHLKRNAERVAALARSDVFRQWSGEEWEEENKMTAGGEQQQEEEGDDVARAVTLMTHMVRRLCAGKSGPVSLSSLPLPSSPLSSSSSSSSSSPSLSRSAADASLQEKSQSLSMSNEITEREMFQHIAAVLSVADWDYLRLPASSKMTTTMMMMIKRARRKIGAKEDKEEEEGEAKRCDSNGEYTMRNEEEQEFTCQREIARQRHYRVMRLASSIPERPGALGALASGMLSADPEVRMAAVTILTVLREDHSTKCLVDELNDYLLCTLNRLVLEGGADVLPFL